MAFPGPGRTLKLYFLDPVEPAKLHFGAKNPAPPPPRSGRMPKIRPPPRFSLMPKIRPKMVLPVICFILFHRVNDFDVFFLKCFLIYTAKRFQIIPKHPPEHPRKAKDN